MAGHHRRAGQRPDLPEPDPAAGLRGRGLHRRHRSHRLEERAGKAPFDYDLRSLHAGLLGGGDGYLCTVRQELDDICRFMRDWRD